MLSAALFSVLLSVQAGKTDQEIKHPWHGEFKDDY